MASLLRKLRFWQRGCPNSSAVKKITVSKRHRLKYESLENRLLLAADSLFVPYDINFDGLTDGGDLLVLQGNLDAAGLNDNTYYHGDFNLDGKIDSADISVFDQYLLNPLPAPTGVYAEFNQFAIDNFGAESEELAYATFGNELAFRSEAFWEYASVNSAAIGFGTNLPARTYIAYGETTDYGQMSVPSERPFSIHVAYLQNLNSLTEYHYRFVAVDERGNILTGEDQTFTTGSLAGKVEISTPLLDAPMILDQAGATYVLTTDVVASSTAFTIKATNITLDLNGHTITYDNVAGAVDPTTIYGSWPYRGPHGLRVLSGQSSIYNGFIVQGPGNAGEGSEPIYAHDHQEVAGVTVEYYGPQLTGIDGSLGDGHHNVIVDSGTVILDRHIGVDAIKTYTSSETLHDNLVKRARHRGLAAAENVEVSNNEVYIDSWDTNSFAIRPGNGNMVDGNRIYGTGYHAIGIGWSNHLTVTDNYVQLLGVRPTARSTEYGLQSSVNGIRLTQYGSATKPYQDNLYEDNVIVVRIREGAQGRGVQFSSDPNVENLVFRDNIVKAIAEDYATWRLSAIVTQGNSNTAAQHLPLVYEGNRLISNRTIVRFGDYYGSGSNQQFIENSFVKVDDHPLFHTFQFDSSSTSYKHIVQDASFEGGAAITDVTWDNSNAQHSFTVRWTLTVDTLPLANVTIHDVNGQELFTGAADNEGHVSVVLSQYLEKYGTNVVYSPHTIAVSSGSWADSQVVLVDRKKTVSLFPFADFDNDGDADGRDFLMWQRGFGKASPTLADGDANSDGSVDRIDLVAWQQSYDGTTTPEPVLEVSSDPPVSQMALASFFDRSQQANWLSSGSEPDLDQSPTSSEDPTNAKHLSEMMKDAAFGILSAPPKDFTIGSDIDSGGVPPTDDLSEEIHAFISWKLHHGFNDISNDFWWQ